MHPFLEVWARLAGASVLFAWVGASAWRLARRRLPGSPPDVIAIAAAAWATATLLVPAMLVGALGVLGPVSWGIGAALAGLGLRAWADRHPEPGPAPVADPASSPSAGFLTVLAGVLVGRAIFVTRNPPADVDSLLYHLPMIAYWTRSGTLGAALAEPPAIGTYFPGNGELLQMFAAWSTGRETLAAWPALLAIALLALALRRLCRDAGASPVVAETMALAAALAPGAIRLTSGIRIDTLLAAWFAIGLMFALRFRRGQNPRALEILLIAGGLVAGAKSNGPAYLAILLAAAFAGLGFRARLGALRRARAGVALAVVVGGFWLVRNLLACGNPLYPAPLSLGPIAFEGLMRTETLMQTSQLFMWLKGQSGHFNLRNLYVFYGPALAVLVLGVAIAGIATWPRARAASPARREDRDAPAGLAVLALVALACLMVFLAGPYSGASHPEGRSGQPLFSVDNMRYLMPAVVALAPIGAAGLTRVPGVLLASALLATALGLGLQPMYSHVLPGLGIALALGLCLRVRRPRSVGAAAAAGLIASVVIAAMVVRFDPLRERVTDQISDGYQARFPSLPSGEIRRLREEAGSRPIACVGVHAWSFFYGRDFSGHPVYVPVATPWERGSRPYHFARDPRDRADRELWLDNLERSGAAFIVVSAWRGCDQPPIEAEWCAQATDRLRLKATHGCRSVYEVLRR